MRKSNGKDHLGIFNFENPVHAILAWNPDEAFDPEAPKGIGLWTKVLENLSRLPSNERYTWWGKISVTGTLGMERPADLWIARFNQQIHDQAQDGETHLYMYCSYFYDERPASLHVGRVIEVGGHHREFLEKEREHIPADFYRGVIKKFSRERYDSGDLIPYWFKLSDIREIRTVHLKNLRKVNNDRLGKPDSGPFEQFFSVNFPSPLPVVEFEPRHFFCREEITESGLSGWWQEIREEPLLVSDDVVREESPGGGEPVTKWKALSVTRRAQKMAQCVAPLLKRSREICFVDPYFSPFDPPRFINPLRAFLDTSWRGRTAPPIKVEYHTLDRFKNRDNFVDECKDRLPEIVPRNWDLVLYLWKEKMDGQPFHARFILTERAGVLFEQGLDEGSKNSEGEVLVTLLTPHIHMQRLRAFREDSGTYELVDKIRIHGNRKMRAR